MNTTTAAAAVETLTHFTESTPWGDLRVTIHAPNRYTFAGELTINRIVWDVTYHTEVSKYGNVQRSLYERRADGGNDMSQKTRSTLYTFFAGLTDKLDGDEERQNAAQFAHLSREAAKLEQQADEKEQEARDLKARAHAIRDQIAKGQTVAEIKQQSVKAEQAGYDDATSAAEHMDSDTLTRMKTRLRWAVEANDREMEKNNGIHPHKHPSDVAHARGAARGYDDAWYKAINASK